MIEFRANVNNRTRCTYFGDTEFAKIAIEAANHGDNLFVKLEFYVNNTESHYKFFYEDATDDDYDAELEDPYVDYIDD